MSSDLRIGKILGIEIFVSYSWFFIFILVTVSLAFGLFPSQFPQHSTATNVVLGLFASALFFASLLFHEMSHSMIGNLNKIPIKRITLFIFGGMSQMSHEPRTPGAEFKMAIAGPLSSLFLAGVFFAVFRLLVSTGLSSVFFAPFAWLAQINLLLALFNLAPGFPLDGGRVLRSIVWHFSGNFEGATNVASKAGQGVAFLLIGFGVVLFLFGQVGGVWLVLIGWFLNQSAVGSFQQVLVQHALENVAVRDIMTVEAKTVSPQTSLQELVDHYFLKHRFGRFPVTEGGDLRGVVTLHDIKEVARENWPNVSAGEIIEPAGDEIKISPGEPAINALTKMAEGDIGHLLVIGSGGHLEGIITKTDIVRLIKVRDELDY